jgi:hypothetical protein
MMPMVGLVKALCANGECFTWNKNMNDRNREQFARVIREEVVSKLSIRVNRRSISYSPDVYYVVELVYDGEVISEDTFDVD